jgi:hypothetical protein
LFALSLLLVVVAQHMICCRRPQRLFQLAADVDRSRAAAAAFEIDAVGARAKMHSCTLKICGKAGKAFFWFFLQHG